MGKFTRYPVNLNDKPSVVDYAICSEPLLREMPNFSVLPFNGMSDHCCLFLKIVTNTFKNDLFLTKRTKEIEGVSVT